MRLYSVAITSLTIRAPIKWTDNLLSQYDIPEVVHQDRGKSRGISWNALVRISLIRSLNQELGCGVRDAVVLAGDLIDQLTGTRAASGSLTLRFERSALESELRRRLGDVIESAPRPRRGRPSRRVARLE
jgi:hypothetical protein